MSNRTTLLVDGDILAYKAAAINQNEYDFGDDEDPVVVSYGDDAKDFIQERLDKYLIDLDASSALVCLSDDDHNFRKDVLPSYKGNRKGVRPELLYPMKDWISNTFPTARWPTLEADDVMGVLSTHPTLISGDKIVISEDKDMFTFTGYLYNPDKHEEPVFVTEDDANWYWMYQTLIGDVTDNYKGASKVGHVRAVEELLYCPSMDHVLSVFISQGHTYEEFLQQARCARILRHTDYNLETQEIRLWTP